MKLGVLIIAFLLAGLSNCSVKAQVTKPGAITNIVDTAITSSTAGTVVSPISTIRVPNIISNGTVVDPTSIKSSDNLLRDGAGAWSNTVQGTAGGLTGGPTPAYNPSTDTIIFSYTKQQVAQQIAINEALKGSGLALLGYSYSWQIGNFGANSGTLSGVVDLKKGNTVLESFTHAYGPQDSDFVSYSGVQPFSKSYPTAAVDSLSLTWTGQDATFWAGYWGPRVRTPSLGLVYGTDLCYASPLSSPSCSGYAEAMKVQMCTANPLSDASCPGYQAAKNAICSANPLNDATCPGYAAALKEQMCTSTPLSDPSCPGYDQAYLNSQCIKDSLYSTKCEGYKTAYAVKYLMPVDSTTSNAINNSLSTTAATKANDPANTVAQPNAIISTTTATTSVSSDGTVSTGVSKTGNSAVDNAIAPPSTTSVSPAAPNSVVQTAPPPAASPMAPAPQQAQNNGPKQDDKGGDKPQSNQQAQNGPGPNQSAPSGNQPQGNNAPQPTARQVIAERREEQRKMDEMKQGKEVAENMKAATSMEQQRAAQGLVISAMAGYSPAFELYKQSILFDAAGYRPYAIYGNQRTVDNRSAQRMFNNNNSLHSEMVDQQYNKEK